MTSLLQLIQESISEQAKSDPPYALRPGEMDAMIMTLTCNKKIPDFKEALDMATRFHSLSNPERLGLAKRLVEISTESDYIVGHRHVEGPITQLWVQEKKSKRLLLDIFNNEDTGKMVAIAEDGVYLADMTTDPSPFKESDL